MQIPVWNPNQEFLDQFPGEKLGNTAEKDQNEKVMVSVMDWVVSPENSYAAVLTPQ